MQTLPRKTSRRCPTVPAARRRRCPAPRCARWSARLSFAITGEDTRYFLNGAKFVLKPDSLDSGGHRRTPSGAGGDEARVRRWRRSRSASSRRRRCSNSGKLLAEGEGDIQFEAGENHLFFEVGGRILISRMIDGKFPAYDRVIPGGQRQDDRVRSRARVDERREARGPALERAIPRREDRTCTGKVDVTSSSSEFGEASEQLTVEYSAGRSSPSPSTRSTCSTSLNVVETDVVALRSRTKSARR